MKTTTIVPFPTRTARVSDPRYAAVKFFLLAFVISWLYWLPFTLDHFGWLPSSLPEPVITLAGLGALGPGLAALILVFLRARWTGVRALLESLGDRRVGWRWVAAATLVYPALLLLVAGLHNLLAAEPSLEPQPVSVANLPVLALILLLTVLGEEIGWRGYALPRLQGHWNALWSSLILGTVGTLWHVPFWFLQPTFVQYGWGYFALNWAWILAVTIFITWLTNNTGNGLLLAVLFHWSFNMVSVGFIQVTGFIVPYLVLIAFSWAIAVVLLCTCGTERLVRKGGVNVRVAGGTAVE